MKKSLTPHWLVFLLGMAVCLACLVIPSSAVADGTGGNPPPPDPPVDTTIVVPFVPDEPSATPVSSDEQSLWEAILAYLSFEA